MSKRKILITVLVFLLIVLVVYLFMISSVNEKKPEESVVYPIQTGCLSLIKKTISKLMMME